MLGILGIFFENVTGENFVGNIGETLKLLLGKKKFLFGNMGEIFENIILGKILFGKIGNILLGKISLPIFVEQSLCEKFYKRFCEDKLC